MHEKRVHATLQSFIKFTKTKLKLSNFMFRNSEETNTFNFYE